jgi:hypothetical protein
MNDNFEKWYLGAIEEAKTYCRSVFKNRDGTPIVLTDSQAQLFVQIFYRLFPRNFIMTPTRWGKSLTIALAVLRRVTTYPEKWAVISGKKEKAQIIMDYVIEHIFDDPGIAAQFQVEAGEDIDYIRKHRNKRRVNFAIPNPDGGVHLLSDLYVQSAEEALGFGAQNVIEDESSLIDDNAHSFVKRMLGDNPHDNFLCEIGNPFIRNHFLKASRDPAYHHFIVTTNDAIREGRLTQAFLDEMRQQPNFAVLYGDPEKGPQFPDADALDEDGYSQLIAEDELDRAYVTMQHVGELRLGVDIAGEGSAFTTMWLRSDTYAERIFKSHTPDLMIIPGIIAEQAKRRSFIIDDKHVFLDKNGQGAGVCSRMDELYAGNSFGISASQSPQMVPQYPNEWAIDSTGKQVSIFLNARSQWAWRMANWIRRGGRVGPKGALNDILDVRYKVQSDKKIKLKSKDEMRKNGIASPDDSDGLSFTFATTPTPKRKPLKENPWKPMTEYGI